MKKNKQVKKTKNVKISNLSDCESGLKVCEQINDTFENNPSVSDKTLLNLTDQDCRIMKSDSTTKECFNAQIITNHQVIVAADVTNQENDQNQLEPMVEQLKENLALTSDSCEARDDHHEPSTENQSIHLAADAGYNQGKNLAYLDKEKNIDAFISMKNRKEEQDLESNPYHKDHFKYDEDEDHYICPEGKTLEFHKDKVTDGKKSAHYYADLTDCVLCSKNANCIKTKSDRKKGCRTIVDDGFNLYRKEMKAKMQEPESKEIYKKRSSEVEPVFGQITYNRNYRRFRLRGLNSVKGEFMLVALAHNLGKIMKHQQKGWAKQAYIKRQNSENYLVFMKYRYNNSKLHKNPDC